MHYKNYLLIACLTWTCLLLGQDQQLSFLDADSSWGSEIIPFPVDWAPGMTLTGYEELRFSPQWSAAESPGFWSLVMGWKVTSDHKLRTKEIENNLKHYYDGLMKPNHWATEFPSPIAKLTAITEQELTNTYTGKITIFDGFHTGKVITLNIQATQKYDAVSTQAFVVIRFSPKPFDHAIWKELQEISVKNNR